MKFLAKLQCLLFGHGNFKQYWRKLGENVDACETRCELCGTKE